MFYGTVKTVGVLIYRFYSKLACLSTIVFVTASIQIVFPDPLDISQENIDDSITESGRGNLSFRINPNQHMPTIIKSTFSKHYLLS